MDKQVGLRGHRIQNHERTEARRREILITAAQVFSRAGHAYATLDDVAAEMGVSRGVIYYYFRSKEELLTEVVKTASGEAGDRLEAIIARNDPPEVTLKAALEDLAAHLFADIDRFANVVVGSGGVRGQGWMTATQPVRHRYRTLIRGIIEDGIRAGVFVDFDPSLMAISVLQSVLGTVDWYRPNGRLSQEEVLAQVVELTLRGVRRC
ncbi:MAG: TetR/AcrR family transcriptional regulator [Dehalococcoidia bacterium]